MPRPLKGTKTPPHLTRGYASLDDLKEEHRFGEDIYRHLSAVDKFVQETKTPVVILGSFPRWVATARNIDWPRDIDIYTTDTAGLIHALIQEEGNRRYGIYDIGDAVSKLHHRFASSRYDWQATHTESKPRKFSDQWWNIEVVNAQKAMPDPVEWDIGNINKAALLADAIASVFPLSVERWALRWDGDGGIKVGPATADYPLATKIGNDTAGRLISVLHNPGWLVLQKRLAKMTVRGYTLKDIESDNVIAQVMALMGVQPSLIGEFLVFADLRAVMYQEARNDELLMRVLAALTPKQMRTYRDQLRMYVKTKDPRHLRWLPNVETAVPSNDPAWAWKQKAKPTLTLTMAYGSVETGLTS